MLSIRTPCWPILPVLIILLVACGGQSTVSEQQSTDVPDDIPADARVYRVDRDNSELRILVFRGGALASLGHNHVISSSAIDGTLWLGADPRAAVLLLTVPVIEFDVDLPELRTEEGDDFPNNLDQAAIDGTRSNMLGDKVLDAELYPEITLLSREITGELPELIIGTDVDLRGQTTGVQIPARVSIDGSTVTASGEFSVLQTELGMEPFSVLLGALAVQDELRIKYRITARLEDS